MIKKITLKAEDFYSSIHPTMRQLGKGDVFYVGSEEPVILGGKYENCPSKIVKIYYEPRKWW